MTEPGLVRPDYAERFRCIGSACEDTCCKGWGIPVDREAYEKYRKLPPSPLRNLIQISCLITPKDAVCVDGSGQIVPGPEVFAKIRMTDANYCPMLQGDGLCRIQSEYGAEFLSHACASYPRIVHSINGIEEKALALSCPEAARLVLLDPWLFAPTQPAPVQPRPPDSPHNPQSQDNPAGAECSLLSWFWSIRECVLALVRNRSYELWQRLFLLGIFCRRLDTIAEGELKIAVPAFLREFEASTASGRLRTAIAAMETHPTDNALQLHVVLKLAGMLLKDSSILPRFSECIDAFTAGIGNGPGATMESLTAHYALAHDRFYAPFFDRHPHILENYLINTIVRCQFPLREGMRAGVRPSMAHEYARLTAQFALMKGLLIGVAGSHREAFSAEHVVHTVQAASRHFDHHPHFLAQAHALLVESQMDGARGLAVLLRNAEPAAAKAAPAAYAATPQRQAS
ncbi:MAG TPA: flagellin lysine-N-methylase [Terriglobales bacterium]|nr:flagellin lysine-N-methylase [Terriglobales bacterium]